MILAHARAAEHTVKRRKVCILYIIVATDHGGGDCLGNDGNKPFVSEDSNKART